MVSADAKHQTPLLSALTDGRRCRCILRGNSGKAIVRGIEEQKEAVPPGITVSTLLMAHSLESRRSAQIAFHSNMLFSKLSFQIWSEPLFSTRSSSYQPLILLLYVLILQSIPFSRL